MAPIEVLILVPSPGANFYSIINRVKSLTKYFKFQISVSDKSISWINTSKCYRDLIYLLNLSMNHLPRKVMI